MFLFLIITLITISAIATVKRIIPNTGLQKIHAIAISIILIAIPKIIATSVVAPLKIAPSTGTQLATF